MFKNSNESVEKGEHIPQRKELLRLSQITESKGLSDTKKLQQSREIVQKIRHHPCWNESQSLLGFMPMRDEPDIFPLLQDIVERGKNLYLPQYQSESKTYIPVLIQDLKYDLILGKFGILEPNPRCSIVNTSHMDLTLIPGLAFDSRGWRLGRGKGFYDRLLAKLDGVRFGVAFNHQWLESVPHETLDQKMDWIITPSIVAKAFD